MVQLRRAPIKERISVAGERSPPKPTLIVSQGALVEKLERLVEDRARVTSEYRSARAASHRSRRRVRNVRSDCGGENVKGGKETSFGTVHAKLGEKAEPSTLGAERPSTSPARPSITAYQLRQKKQRIEMLKEKEEEMHRL